MILDVFDMPTFFSTGGVDLECDGAMPIALLVHGAGMDSSVWQLQTRYLANRGICAIAVDLPGHGRSGGAALATIEAMAEWLLQFYVELKRMRSVMKKFHLVGHSMGTFIALELAKANPDLVCSLTLCGTATAMPVHPDLLNAAANDVPAASALMASWGHDKPAHVGVNPAPGMWMLGGARALVERSAPGVLAADFGACVGYVGALDAATRVACPTTVVVGLGDKMTPPKGARTLVAALANPNVIELPGVGHMMMSENPQGVREAIRSTVLNSPDTGIDAPDAGRSLV